MKKILTNSNFWVVLVVVALSLFGIFEYHSARNAKTELALAKQNLIALNDTLRITKTKARQTEYDKAIDVAKVKDLEKLNADLAKEAKDTKGDVATIAKATVSIKADTSKALASTKTIVAPNGDTIFKTDFSQDTTYSKGNYSKVAGTIEYNTANKGTIATITKNEIGFALVTGIKNIHTKPEIFIRSTYPGLTVTDLQGAILDPSIFQTPKPSRLSFGLQLGFSPLAYDLSTKSIQTHSQITIGAGLNYRLF